MPVRYTCVIRLLLLLFLSVGLSTFGQQTNGITTSSLLLQVSDGWKKDSIGATQFRLQHFKVIRESKVDSVSKDFLYKTLGKPYRVQHFIVGFGSKRGSYVGFVYLIFYEKFEVPYMGPYIIFVFDESETLLQYIDDGDYCA